MIVDAVVCRSLRNGAFVDNPFCNLSVLLHDETQTHKKIPTHQQF